MAKRTFKHRTYTTRKIVEAFEAAMCLYAVWESPKGKAVVVDVLLCVGQSWQIVYRLMSEWGKKVWDIRQQRE